MGRKTLPYRPRVYRIVLSLHPGRDDDLIAYLDAAPLRGLPTAVVTAMRGGNLIVIDQVEVEEQEMEGGLESLMF